MEWYNYTEVYRSFEEKSRQFDKLYLISTQLLQKIESDAKTHDLFKGVLKTEYNPKFNRLHLFMLGQEFVIIPSMNYPQFYTGHLKCYIMDDSIKLSEIDNSQPLLDIEFSENQTVNHGFSQRDFSLQYILNIYDEYLKIKIANGTNNRFELKLRKFES
jgi:hypothetical protein